jgi:hypothetical protein
MLPAAVAAKLVPVMVTWVPAVASTGVKEIIAGIGATDSFVLVQPLHRMRQERLKVNNKKTFSF